MKSGIIIFILLFVTESLICQSSDVLVLKRRDGKRVSSFMQGGQIAFLEKSGASYSGKILRIDRDTIFMAMYDVRRMSTSTGGLIIDTVTRFQIQVDHRDIVSVVKPPQSFVYIRNGSLIKWSGVGYGVLHLLNAAISKEPIVGSQLGGALLATGVGFLLSRIYKGSYFLGRRHNWQYVDL